MISKVIQKIRNKHFLSFAGNGTMSVLSMITYAIMYRILPEIDMGNWIFFQFMYALLDSLRTGFLQTALIKFYSGSTESRKNNIAGSSWLIAIGITLLFAVINIPLFWIKDNLTDRGIILFIEWYGLSLICTLPFNVAFWILQAEQNFDNILLLRLINQGSFILLLLCLLLLQNVSLIAVIYLYLISSLITSCFALFFGWAKLSTLKYRSVSAVKEVYHFGKFSVGTYIGSTLLRSSDSIIIKFMIGPVALAIYNLAQRVGEVIELLIRSFMGTAMPTMAAAFNQKKYQNIVYIMKKYASTLTIILIPVIILMFIFANILVSFLGGHKYNFTEAPNLLRIFMCLAITFPLDRFFGITLDIIHRPELNLLKVFFTLLVNVVTDIVALKVVGNIYGVALASFITLTFGILFGYYTLKKYLPFTLEGMWTLGYSETKSMILSAVKILKT